MAKNLHIVFPKEYKEILIKEMSKKEYNVVNYDYSLETFLHWAQSQEETIADTVLMAETFNSNIPIEVKIHEFIEKLTEIRVARPSLRLAIFLPSDYKHITYLKEQLVKLVIYDFHFFDNFSFDDLLEGLEKQKSIADIKEYIQIDTTPREVIQEKILNTPVVGQKTEHSSSTEIEEPKSRQERTQQRQHIKTIVEKEIIERVITLSQKSIAFHSISRGAGSTFHSLNLGGYYSEKKVDVGIYEEPSYYEGRTYQADALSLFKMDDNTNFSAPHQIVKRMPVFQEQILSVNKINYYPVDHEQEKLQKFEYEDYVRYLNIGKENLKIMDLGYVPFSRYEKDWFRSILSTFDLHIVCVDLMPTGLIPNNARLTWFLNNKERMNIQFLINPMPRKFTKSDLIDFGIEDALRCPVLNRDKLFNAFYHNELPYNYDKEIKEELITIYDEVNANIGFKVVGDYPIKKGLFSWPLKKTKHTIH